MFSEIVGWLGAGFVIGAYFLVSTKKLSPTSTTFDNENHLSSGHNDVGLSPLGVKQVISF